MIYTRETDETMKFLLRLNKNLRLVRKFIRNVRYKIEERKKNEIIPKEIQNTVRKKIIYLLTYFKIEEEAIKNHFRKGVHKSRTLVNIPEQIMTPNSQIDSNINSRAGYLEKLKLG